MKTYGWMVFLFLFSTSPVLSQHFILGGFGINGLIINSDDLERFTSTYNSVNQASLTSPFKGLNDAFGIGVTAGYWHLSRINSAVFFGYQSFNDKNAAQFANGENRKLELKINHFYLEGQLGKSWDNLLFTGMLNLHIYRKISLVSTYLVPGSQQTTKTLDGTYSATHPFSIDLGLVFGVYRSPLVLMGRISYPVYIKTDPQVLTDTNPSKVQEGTHIFPDDYFAYTSGEPYNGVSGKVDGLKISITMYFAFQLKP
jgi:hypothetical protein